MPRPIVVKIKRLASGAGVPLPQKMTEHAAYAMLRKRAMDQSIKLVDVARQIVASAGLPE